MLSGLVNLFFFGLFGHIQVWARSMKMIVVNQQKEIYLSFPGEKEERKRERKKERKKAREREKGWKMRKDLFCQICAFFVTLFFSLAVISISLFFLRKKKLSSLWWEEKGEKSSSQEIGNWHAQFHLKRKSARQRDAAETHPVQNWVRRHCRKARLDFRTKIT